MKEVLKEINSLAKTISKKKSLMVLAYLIIIFMFLATFLSIYCDFTTQKKKGDSMNNVSNTTINININNLVVDDTKDFVNIFTNINN